MLPLATIPLMPLLYYLAERRFLADSCVLPLIWFVVRAPFETAQESRFALYLALLELTFVKFSLYMDFLSLASWTLLSL